MAGIWPRSFLPLTHPSLPSPSTHMVRGHGQVGRHVAVDFAEDLEGGLHSVVGHDDDDEEEGGLEAL